MVPGLACMPGVAWPQRALPPPWQGGLGAADVGFVVFSKAIPSILPDQNSVCYMCGHYRSC